MQAGAMRRRITITAPTITQDAAGQPGVSGPGTTVLTCWASITTASSKEIYALGPGFTAQVTHKIVIRFPDASIKEGMVVAYLTRTFLIQDVADPDESRRQLVLMCLEQTK